METAYKFYRFPAAFLAAGWPFIVHAARVSTHLDQYPWYPDVTETVDFFLVYKSRALCIISLIMLFLLIVRIISALKTATENGGYAGFGWKEDLEKRREDRRVKWIAFVTFAIFIAGVLLSSLRSSFIHTVWSGMTEQYEGLPVILSYLIIFIFCVTSFRKKEDFVFLRRAILIGTALQCLIGIGQMLGYDVFSSDIGLQLIGAGMNGRTKTEFIFAKEAGERVYMCFYHPNYAAVYLMLMLPVCLYSLKACIPSTGGDCCEGTGEKHSIVKGACNGLLLISMILCLAGTGSKTAAGVLIICAAAAIMKSILRQVCKKGRHNGNHSELSANRSFIGTAVRVFAAVLVFAGIMLLIWNLTKNSGWNPASRIMGEKTHKNLLDVKPEADGVHVNWKGNKFLLAMQQEDGKAWFSVVDEHGYALPLDYESAAYRYTIKDPECAGLSFDAWTDRGALCITMYQQVLHGENAEEIPWYFRLEKEQKTWQYITLYQKPDTPVNAPHTATFGFDNGLSGRIYIWSRTVPLLKERILLGSGADSFALSFPQNDYAARANVGLDLLMPVISRAHSLYLQCAVQFGVFPTICLSAVLLTLIFGRSNSTTNRCRERDENRILAGMNHSFRISLLLWLLMGITNDSVIVVTPFVCMIAGLVASLQQQTISDF